VSYRIDIGPEARLELETLPAAERDQAREMIRSLALYPRPARAKSLCGEPEIYRLWLATLWRIAYQVDEPTHCVRVLRVFRPQLFEYDSLLSRERGEPISEFQIEARGDEPDR
jgi:mRNA-degrading endonuclease RelE of RelBE toxin-antitoxin system